MQILCLALLGNLCFWWRIKLHMNIYIFIASSTAGIVKTEKNVITKKWKAAVHVYFMFLPTRCVHSLHCWAYTFMHVLPVHVICKGQGGWNIGLEQCKDFTACMFVCLIHLPDKKRGFFFLFCLRICIMPGLRLYSHSILCIPEEDKCAPMIGPQLLIHCLFLDIMLKETL